MSNLTNEQAERMRKATGIRLIKKMSPEEINETFENQFEEIEDLKGQLQEANERIAELEQREFQRKRLLAITRQG